MRDIVINSSIPSNKLNSTSLRLQTRQNGDVEIVTSTINADSVLGVIPKDKRCEVAQFLVNETQ